MRLIQGNDPTVDIYLDLDGVEYPVDDVDTVEWIVKQHLNGEPAGSDVDGRAPALCVTSADTDSFEIDPDSLGTHVIRLTLTADQVPPPGSYVWRIDTITDNRRTTIVEPTELTVVPV